MFRSLFSKNLSYIFLALIALCFSQGCGSDKQGDEIGALKKNNYRETYDVGKNELFTVSGIRGPEVKSELTCSKLQSGTV